MKKEEKILKDKFGKTNPFTVPKGYFESFATQMTELLPETEARIVEMHTEVWWRHLSIRKTAAVIGIAIALSSGTLLFLRHQSQGSVNNSVSKVQEATSNSTEYSNFDQMADYTMMDSQAIYASLVAEN